jgi:hypothetical protein
MLSDDDEVRSYSAVDLLLGEMMASSQARAAGLICIKR